MATQRASAVAAGEKRRPSAVWLALKDELASDPQAGLKCNTCDAVSVKSKKVTYCRSCKMGWCATCLVLPETKICHLCTSFIAKAQTVWVEGVVPSEFLGKFFSTSFLRIVGDYAIIYPSRPEPATPVGTFDLCTAVTLSTTKYVYVTEASVEKEQSVGEACKEPGSMFTFTLLEGQKKVTHYFIAETARDAQMWIPAITKVVESYHAQFKKGAVKKQDSVEDNDQVMFGNLRVLTGFPKSWKLMPFGLYKGGRFCFFKEDALTPLKCANMLDLKSATFHRSATDGQLLLLSGETPIRSICLRPLPEDVDFWARAIPPVIEQVNQIERQRKEQLHDEKLSSDDLMALAPKDDDIPVSRDSLSTLSPTARPSAPSIAPTFGAGKWDVVRQKLIAQERKQTDVTRPEADQTSDDSSSKRWDQSGNPKSQAELQQQLKKLEERNVSLEAELAELKIQAAVANALQKELADLRAAVVALSTKPLLPQVVPPPPLVPPTEAKMSDPVAAHTPGSPPRNSAVILNPTPGSPLQQPRNSAAILTPSSPPQQPRNSAVTLPPPMVPPTFTLSPLILPPPNVPPPDLPPPPSSSLPPPSLPPPDLPPPPNSSLPPPSLPPPSLPPPDLPPPPNSSLPPPSLPPPDLPPPPNLPSPSLAPPSLPPPSLPPPDLPPPPNLQIPPLPPPPSSLPSPPEVRSTVVVTAPKQEIVVSVPESPSLPLPSTPNSSEPSPTVPNPPPSSPTTNLDDEEARLLEEIAKMERIAALKKKLAELQEQIS